MKICVSIFLVFVVYLATTKLAADLYTSVDEHCLDSLKKAGVTTLIPRCYTNIGFPDRRCGENLDAAIEAGMEVDAYIYPCPSCGNPAKQVADTIANVGKRPVEKYWVIVDNFQWKDKEYNRGFLKAMMEELKKKGKTPGIYTNEFLWESIMGYDWHEMSVYPLWYKRLDGKSACEPFKPFAGWKVLAMKQYTLTKKCQGSSLETIC